MSNPEEEPTIIPIDVSELPPAIQEMIGQIIGSISGIEPQPQPEEDEELPSLGEVVFKLDRLLDLPGGHEPRMALVHARLCPLRTMATAEVDQTLGRIHTYEEAMAEITDRVAERVAFVNSVRPVLRHPDEIIQVFETDYRLNEVFTPFVDNLRDLLRSWKESPLVPHTD